MRLSDEQSYRSSSISSGEAQVETRRPRPQMSAPSRKENKGGNRGKKNGCETRIVLCEVDRRLALFMAVYHSRSCGAGYSERVLNFIARVRRGASARRTVGLSAAHQTTDRSSVHVATGRALRSPHAPSFVISRISQAFAVFQSRVTVGTETPSASAVSSMLNPPK